MLGGGGVTGFDDTRPQLILIPAAYFTSASEGFASPRSKWAARKRVRAARFKVMVTSDRTLP